MVGTILACGSPTQLVTINMDEDRLNHVLQDSAEEFQGENWNFSLQQAVLQENSIRLHGDYRLNDGPEAEGYIEIRLSVVETALESDVIIAKFGELNLDDLNINLLNQRIEGILSRAASNGRQASEFVSIKIMDDRLQIQLRFIP